MKKNDPMSQLCVWLITGYKYPVHDGHFALHGGRGIFQRQERWDIAKPAGIEEFKLVLVDDLSKGLWNWLIMFLVQSERYE